MTRILRSLLLVAAVAGLLAATGLTSAPAQDKAKAKEQPKEELGKVEVYMAKDGWRWKVMNAEGKTIAMGTTGFDRKEDALKTLEVVKATLNKAKVEVKEEKK